MRRCKSRTLTERGSLIRRFPRSLSVARGGTDDGQGGVSRSRSICIAVIPLPSPGRLSLSGGHCLPWREARRDRISKEAGHIFSGPTIAYGTGKLAFAARVVGLAGMHLAGRQRRASRRSRCF